MRERGNLTVKRKFSKLVIILVLLTLFLSSFTVFAEEIGDLQLPDTPEDISISHLENDDFLIDWTCDGEDNFEVYLKEGNSHYKLYDTVHSKSCKITPIDPLQSYYIQVRSIREAGENARHSKFSKEKKVVPFEMLSSKISVANSDTKGVEIKWDEVKNASGYIVLRSVKENEGFSQIAEVSSLSYKDAKLESDTKYFYKVRAFVNLNGEKVETEDSNTVSGYLLNSAPDAPKAKGAFGRIILHWKKANDCSFELLRADSKDGSYEIIAATQDNYFYDNNIEEGRKYYYKLRTVFKNNGESFYSVNSKETECASLALDRKKPVIAFSFDDGPGTQSTTRILDVLEKNNSRATFFTVGCMVKEGQASDNLIRERNMGCELANHTYNHYNLTKLSIEDIKAQVNKTNEAVKRVTGVTPELVRPPYGSNNKTVLETIGAPAILWNIDTLDWKTHDPEKIYDEVVGKVKDGDIVLMHDIHDDTAEAVEKIIPELMDRGYQIVTVSELALYKGKTLEDGKIYYNLR